MRRFPKASPSPQFRVSGDTNGYGRRISRRALPIAIWLLASAFFLPTTASAQSRGFLQNLYDQFVAWLNLGKTAITEKLISPEEFSVVMPEMVRRNGEFGLVGKEIENLGDGPEIFTVKISYFDAPETNRPLVLWIDKIEGSKMTRYADMDSDGILDGVTFDGMPVLSNAAIKALATGDRQMAAAVFKEMKDQASRYQPMYQADYSKVVRLASARYPDK